MGQEPSKSLSKMMDEIQTFLQAKYPILHLITHEEGRLRKLLGDLALRLKRSCFLWTSTGGLRKYGEANSGVGTVNETADPAQLLLEIRESKSSAVYLLMDFHPLLQDPLTVRRLRDTAMALEGTEKTIFLISPIMALPTELEKEMTLIDVPLPEEGELTELLTDLNKKSEATGTSAHPSKELPTIARAARGLTLSEAQHAFARAMVSGTLWNGRGAEVVLEEKKQIIRKSGILEFHEMDAGMEEVGGVANLKGWLEMRAKGFSSKAKSLGVPIPKGVLLLGAPGCGKSLVAKAVASAWRPPLLRLDFGRIFSGLVGSSEENMRRALKIAESIAPAVLWIDEIEKGLAGGGGHGNSDGGTAARVLGTFLTWMQEKKANVFVVATANRIDVLPPELLRRGRFDEIFFVDLPSKSSRAEILKIHLRKKGRPVEQVNLSSVVDLTEGFSGAELEYCVIEGLYLALNQDRDLVVSDLEKAAEKIVPLSITYQEELERIRQWATTRARPADPSAAPGNLLKGSSLQKRVA